MGGVACCQGTLPYAVGKQDTVEPFEEGVGYLTSHLVCAEAYAEHARCRAQLCHGRVCYEKEVEKDDPRTAASERAAMPQVFRCTDSFLTRQRPWRILAYGDSLTAGMCSSGRRFVPYARYLVDEMLPEVAVEAWSCGLSGLRASSLVQALDAREIADCASRTGKGLRRILRESGPFDLALIMAGTNDLSQKQASIDVSLKDPQAIVQAVRELHDACHEEGVPTVALSIPPSRAMSTGLGEWARYQKRWMFANGMMKAWAKSPEASAEGLVGFIDMNEVLPFREGTDLWEKDGLHFSAAGSRYVGKAVARRVAPILSQLPSRTQADPLPQAFSAAPSEQLQHRRRVLAFGDGLTAGARSFCRAFSPYAETLHMALPSNAAVDIIVYGFSGYTVKQLFCELNSPEVKDDAERRGKGLNCILEEDGPFDLALLLAGSQDLAAAVDDPEDVALCLQALHAACHAKSVPTLALSVPAVQDGLTPDPRYADRCRKLNKAMVDWVDMCNAPVKLDSIGAKMPDCMPEAGCLGCIDTTELLQNYANGADYSIELDGVHLTKAGSERLGSGLAKVLPQHLVNIGRHKSLAPAGGG